MTKYLPKFVKRKESLDAFLRSQKCSLEKAELSFNQFKGQKYYKNFYVKSSAFTTPYMTCNYHG